MYMGFKFPGQTIAVTAVAEPFLSRLFYVQDTHTGVRFLVDTGSEVSVISPSHKDRKHLPDKLDLTAINDTPIATYGKRYSLFISVFVVPSHKFSLL